jgi:hypothetical protein
VVVVRAWLDSRRIIVRVLAGVSHLEPASEWVFADIEAACKQVADILCELVVDQPCSGDRESAPTLIRSIDAPAHRDPGR